MSKDNRAQNAPICLEGMIIGKPMLAHSFWIKDIRYVQPIAECICKELYDKKYAWVLQEILKTHTGDSK